MNAFDTLQAIQFKTVIITLIRTFIRHARYNDEHAGQSINVNNTYRTNWFFFFKLLKKILWTWMRWYHKCTEEISQKEFVWERHINQKPVNSFKDCTLQIRNHFPLTCTETCTLSLSFFLVHANITLYHRQYSLH